MSLYLYISTEDISKEWEKLTQYLKIQESMKMLIFLKKEKKSM